MKRWEDLFTKDMCKYCKGFAVDDHGDRYAYCDLYDDAMNINRKKCFGFCSRQEKATIKHKKAENEQQHGRLIDADEIMEILSHFKGNDVAYSLGAIENLIKNAPTVIESKIED